MAATRMAFHAADRPIRVRSSTCGSPSRAAPRTVDIRAVTTADIADRPATVDRVLLQVMVAGVRRVTVAADMPRATVAVDMPRAEVVAGVAIRAEAVVAIRAAVGTAKV